MTRKMAYIGSAYLIGLLFASFFSSDINFLVSAVLLIAVTAVSAFGRKNKIKIVVCIASAFTAIMLYSIYDVTVYRNVIKYDGYDVEIVGTVSECNVYDGDKSSYVIKGVINGDVKATVTCYTDTYSAEVGDKVKLVGQAKLLEDSYKFPTKSYYKSKGIFLSVNKVNHINFEHSNDFSFRKIILKYREIIIDSINRNMSSKYSGYMVGMLFGDKTGIESTEKTLMNRAGIGHIMSVSGVHLSVICSFFSSIISRLPLNKYWRFLILMIPVMCFVVLAGMSSPVLRSAIMIVFVYSAELFRRKNDTFTSLAFAVIMLSLPCPFIVRDASFLLSVTGVFGIGVAAPKVIKDISEKHTVSKLENSLISSMCVMIISFPVTVLFFDEVSVISPVSNLLLLPICELVLIGGVIVTLTGGVDILAFPVLKICEVCCVIVARVSEFIGGLRFSYIPLGDETTSAAVSIALMLGIIAVVFCRDTLYSVVISLLIFIMLICYMYAKRLYSDGSVTAAVIRNGAAVSLIVHDNNSADIIDLNDGGKTAELMMKYLNRNGIYKINSIMMNVDANSSVPIYDKYFGIYDIAYYLIPECDKKYVYGNTDKMMFYTDERVIENENCSVALNEDETIIITVNGADFLLCNSAQEVLNPFGYDVVLLYSGKKFKTEISADIFVFMNEKSETEAYSDKIVYAGESVCFEISEDGQIFSGILN